MAMNKNGIVVAFFWVLCWALIIPPTDVIRTIDGDTFIVRVDIPQHPAAGTPEARRVVVRILGVNAPEMQAPTLAKATAAKLFVVNWLAMAEFVLRTQEPCRLDFNGRQLATVTRGDENLATELIKANLGVAR
jgi:endonuclease YncB( thermonuclease family)